MILSIAGCQGFDSFASHCLSKYTKIMDIDF